MFLDYNTPVVVEGRNSASSWAFITADGLAGWASAAWLRDFSAPLSSVPVMGADAETSGRTTVVAGENTAVVRAELNLRDAPGFGGNIITVLAPQSLVALDGRDYTSDWAQVTTVDGGLAGWVAIGWLRLPAGFSVEALPITAEAPTYDTAAAVGDVATTVNLPAATIANATTIAARGSALGRNRLRFIRVGDSNSVGGAFFMQFPNMGAMNWANLPICSQPLMFIVQPFRYVRPTFQRVMALAVIPCLTRCGQISTVVMWMKAH